MNAIQKRGWLLVVGALTACHPAKPAVEPAKPAPAAKPTARPKPNQADTDPSFRPDATDAMAALLGYWSLLGISDAAKETPKSWHRHAASGTCMPEGSKSWRVTNTRVYGPDDESVSLWNDQLKILVTLFTYPARHPVGPEFDDVMRQMSGTCTEGPVMTTNVGDVHVGGCVRRLKNNALLLEQAVLFQHDKWFHEARITFAAAGARDAYTPAMSLFSESFAPCKK